jgi:hypothetical protein
MENTQFDQIMERLDQISTLIANKKTGPRPGKMESGNDLTRQRVERLESLFWSMVNLPIEKKKGAFQFPKYLIQKLGNPSLEAVLVSTLLNQASMRRAFKVKGLGDFANETPLDRAKRALNESNLVVLPMNQTDFGNSETLVAFSPGEAQRVALHPENLPRSKGWTTQSRAQAVLNPFDDGRGKWLQVPEDQCGVRVWEIEPQKVAKVMIKI